MIRSDEPMFCLGAWLMCHVGATDVPVSTDNYIDG